MPTNEATLRTLAQAEADRRRQRLEERPVTLPSVGTVHPLKTLLHAFVQTKGSVYTSAQLAPLIDVSLDVARFVDVLRDLCVQFGKLAARPAYSEMAYSLNFTPRLDTDRPAVTVNLLAPVAAKLVLWTEADGSWSVRHNAVGAVASKVVQDSSPATTVPALTDRGALFDEEVGKQSRSIQLD